MASQKGPVNINKVKLKGDDFSLLIEVSSQKPNIVHL